MTKKEAKSLVKLSKSLHIVDLDKLDIKKDKDSEYYLRFSSEFGNGAFITEAHNVKQALEMISKCYEAGSFGDYSFNTMINAFKGSIEDREKVNAK